MSADHHFNYTYKLLQNLCRALGGQDKLKETMESITTFILSSGKGMIVSKSIDEELLLADIRFHLIKNKVSGGVENFFFHHESLKASQYDDKQRLLLLIFLLYMAEDKKNNALQRLNNNNWNRGNFNVRNNEITRMQTVEIRSNNVRCFGHTSSTSDISRVYLSQQKIITPHALNDELIQNIIYSFTGVNGKYFQKDDVTSKFRFVVKLNLPCGLIDKILELSELGYYHDRLITFTDTTSFRCPVGLMGQGLLTAFKNELSLYYENVAILQDQFNSQNSKNILSNCGSNKLGLLGLTLWSLEPIHRMSWLTKIAHACEGKMGGPLATTVYKFISNGDLKVVKMVKEFLLAVTSPLKKMLSSWLLEGIIVDPFNEFFVEIHLNVKPTQLWEKKYQLRTEMIPEFIPLGVANKILNTGKTVNFLREGCNDVTPIKETKFLKQCLKEKSIYKLPSTCEPLNIAINDFYKSSSMQLVDVIVERFKFIDHLLALRNFLLLGSGGFINALIQELGAKLDKPSDEFYLCRLSKTLYSCIQSTNARYIDSEIVNSLEIKLLEPSYLDKTGWDIFAFKYNISDPVSCLLKSSIPKYNILFKRLWRFKQIDYIVSNKIWKCQRLNQIKYQPINKCFNIFIYQLNILTSAMINLMGQINFYIFIEVIDASWIKLKESFTNQKGIDNILKCHDEYLDRITTGIFLTNEDESIAESLDEIFMYIEQLESWQENFFNLCSNEMESLVKETDFVQRSNDKINFDQSLLSAQIGLDFTEMNYKTAVNKLIVYLYASNESNLESLAQTIDYNDFYESHISLI